MSLFFIARKFPIDFLKIALPLPRGRASFFICFSHRKRVIKMDSNDFGDILLMFLDDDLFWNDDKEQPCGDTLIPTPNG